MFSSQLGLGRRNAGGYDTRGATLYSKNGKKLSSMDMESISCSFCHLVLKQPVQLISCGDRFCRLCLASISKCPVDGEVIDSQQTREDKGCQNELLSLEISCTMVSKGCTWRGPLVNIEDHKNICTFATETCPRCDQNIPKHKVDTHMSEDCPNMEIKCAYQGCDKVMLLSQSGDHYSQHMHRMAILLNNTLLTVEKLIAENTQLRQQQEKMQEEITSFKLCVKQPFRSQHLIETDGDGPTDPKACPESLTSDQGYGSSLVSASSTVSTTGMDDTIFHIQTQLGYIQPMLEELREEVRRQASQLVGYIESVQAVQETVTRHAVAMEDVKLRQDILDVKTTTGVFVWKIPDVKKRYKDAGDRRTLSLYSPPFHTSPHGYRMCIRAYLNGDGSGKGTHISVFLVLMRSEQDNLLRWPFTQPVTFTLVNQTFPSRNISETFLPDSQSPSFQQPHSEMNVASGFPSFASQSVLNDESFTKGNALYIRCQIDTRGLTAY